LSHAEIAAAVECYQAAPESMHASPSAIAAGALYHVSEQTQPEIAECADVTRKTLRKARDGLTE
jgi:transcription initiation factor TFIIIB Brf1 subunit/transcription initiation factor TFIIB